MSIAKELFKEVGYEKAEKSESIVLYTNGYGDTISFEKNKHVVIKPIQGCRTIIMTCLLENAIHKQCEELGWIDEEKNEIKQETNYEHYKDEIIEYYGQNLAVVKGRPTLCCETNCNNCDFKINQIGCRETAKYWLKKPYKKLTYKLNKFEYDLIQTYSDCNDECKFCDFMQLNKLKNMGYFSCIDSSIKISDILENCEISDNESN